MNTVSLGVCRRKGLCRLVFHKAVEGSLETSRCCNKGGKAGNAWKDVAPSHPRVSPHQASTIRLAVAGPCLDEYQDICGFAKGLPASTGPRI